MYLNGNHLMYVLAVRKHVLVGPASGLEGVFPHASGVQNLVLVFVCICAFVEGCKALGKKLEWQLEQGSYETLELFCLVHLSERMASASSYRDCLVDPT